MEELTGIYKEITEHTFSPEKCFLCGCHLTDKNRTVEHVIPKWLQRKFNLWDQKIILLNGTSISYKDLTIPCCFECNNIHLQPFEDIVKEAFEKGYEGITHLNKETLFLWLGKIYFGIMYRELFLNVDMRNPSKGRIVTPEYLKSFDSHFLFLQGIRKKHSFCNFFPASIYIFKTQKPEIIEKQWDYIDDQQTLFISIRMGGVGLICLLQDCEATKGLEKKLESHKKLNLHPLQFRELSAKILYAGCLMNRNPTFINTQTENENVSTFLLPLQSLSSEPIFDDWNNKEYSIFLSKLTGEPPDKLQGKNGKVLTWLLNEKEEPIFIDVNEKE